MSKKDITRRDVLSLDKIQNPSQEAPINPIDRTMTRRQFLKFLKGLSETSLASFLGITIVDEKGKNPLEEDKELIKLVTDLAIYYRGKSIKPTQPGPGSVEFRNLEMYQRSIDDTERQAELERIRARYSIYADEIHPVVRSAIPGHLMDFDKIPEIQEARKIKNVHERVWKIIKILAVQTKGDLLRSKREMRQSNNLIKLLILRDNLNLIIQNFDNLKISETSRIPDISSLRKLLDKVSKIIETIQLSSLDFDQKMGSNPAWSDKLSCNLYASTLIAALGLGHRLSHRVDEHGRPVRTGGRELSAEDTHNWLNKNGEKYGWIRVTNLSYAEKVDMLRKGYIFYGTHPGHNWIITGVEIQGEIQPALNQATNHTLLKLFDTKNIIRSIVESYSGFIQDTREGSVITKEDYYYGANYKIMPYGHGEEELWAIHVDDSKNKPISH